MYKSSLRKPHSLILLLHFLLKGSRSQLWIMSAVITVSPLRRCEIWLATLSERSGEPRSTSGFVDSAKAFNSEGKSTIMSLTSPTWNYDTPMQNIYYIFSNPFEMRGGETNRRRLTSWIRVHYLYSKAAVYSDIKRTADLKLNRCKLCLRLCHQL